MTERGRIGVDTSGAIVEVDATFCHTLNALIDSGKQVIVAADRALRRRPYRVA